MPMRAEHDDAAHAFADLRAMASTLIVPSTG
jgi:hypothetical protein